jgi:hypothetical protein
MTRRDSSVRGRTPSLAKMRPRWASIVLRLGKSLAAISGLEAPWATSGQLIGDRGRGAERQPCLLLLDGFDAWVHFMRSNSYFPHGEAVPAVSCDYASAYQ